MHLIINKPLADIKGKIDSNIIRVEDFNAFLLFFFGDVFVSASCTILQTSVHSSSGTLFTRSHPLSLFITSTVYL